MRRPFRFGLLVVALLAAFTARPAAAADLLVFAAASLKNALDDAIADYGKRTGVKIDVSYAASGPLARQIEAGAPADLFISADLQWMDEIAQHDLIRPESRVDLLGNRLVLVAAKDDKRAITIGPDTDLAALIGSGRLAIGDPQSVPAGKYAESALEKLGLWAKVEPKLARAESVRAALALVSRGEAPLGIVYATDAAADPGVRVAAEFPATSYPPVIYPAALVKASHSPQAQPFLEYLEGAAAAPFFTRQGFTRLVPPA
ncbi:molybdate ABC transporter substrate-binding protein [Aliidongia dinghuensis]|uniref:Molybdate ABC transporter substrate-binding protein n=1 Tax=Aliidongia dinghuensis TaxID=1867774 RepID=A0A8J2YPH9_9PROT|nr:molybdate ABC transporter substrate-binding protein [Aliidongia dinghuensis]GGE99414.1 molybdate ABC transporter substrate-binding protein [Aliidongia dinghuensis]